MRKTLAGLFLLLSTSFATLDALSNHNPKHYEPAPDIRLNTAGATPPQPTVGDPIWGWADLHAHQFANYGFGGHLVTGHPWGEPSWALIDPWKDHGVIGCSDWIGNLLRHELGGSDNLCHDVSGYPNFSGWPAWNTFTHQTMYYKWVQRAYLGGQRLMVTAAVSNSVLCEITDIKAVLRDFDCNDMNNANTQLAMAKHLEFWIDVNDDGERNQSGWYRIAYTPEQARQIISEGDMAVILAIEVDTLFNCSKNAPCSDTHIRTQLDRYYDMGVRHIFPIHLYDNHFGGAAIYDETFNAANYLATGDFYQADPAGCGSGYDFKMIFTQLAQDLIAVLSNEPVDFNVYLTSSTCNNRGLQPSGETLITELMNRGMMIDVDHMSKKMRGAIIDAATLRSYPLISGHNLPNGILKNGHKAESNLSDADIRAITELGGMVAINIAAKKRGEVNAFVNDQGETPIPFNCSQSSEGWAQSYLYALQKVRENAGEELASVGIGTDFNGFVLTPRGRLTSPGTDCERHRMVQYPFSLHGLTGTMQPQQSGNRTFNINFDGVAHVGMLPDFIQELKMLGMRDSDLDPLFRSAEKYIQAWEKAVAASDPGFNEPPPRVIATVDPAPQVNGWYLGPVGVHLDLAEADPDADIVYNLSGATSSAEITTAPPANLSIAAEGQTVISYHSVNRITGKRSVGDPTVINIDTSSPEVTFDVPPYHVGQWFNAPVAVGIRGLDDVSGIQSLHYLRNSDSESVVVEAEQTEVTFDSDGEHQLQAWTRDSAGHSSNTLTITVPLDQHAPQVTLTPSPSANSANWYNQPVLVSAQAVDPPFVPSTVTCDAPVTRTIEGANQSATLGCNDRAGNRGSATLSGINIDLTPPGITCPPSLTLQVGADGTVPPANWTIPTVSDALSGVLPPLTVATAPTPSLDQGDLFPLGTTTVTYTASDLAGNLNSCSFTVTLLDVTPPVLTLPADFAVEATGPDGTLVHFVTSADDNVDGEVPVSCVPPSGATFALGATTVTCSAADHSGNLNEGGFKVTVEDTTPPALSCPGAPLELVYRQPDGPDLIAEFLGSATATDIVDQDVLLAHAVAGVATDPGRHDVTFTATDFSGNQSSCNSHIQVSYQFGGFEAPLSLDKPIKLGRVVVIKFALLDALGNLVSDATAMLNDLVLLTNTTSGEIAIEPDSPGNADGGRLFRYDAEAGQYLYNLSTKPLFDGTWLVGVELNDGQIYAKELMLK